LSILSGDDKILQIVIVRILPNSQANHVGLQPGDIIESYSGEKLVRMSSLIAAVQRPGDSPRELIVLRGGQILQFQVASGRLGVELREIAAAAEAQRGTSAKAQR
jgi:S1-C subfamily serine protease